MKKILTYIALSISFISFSQEQIHWMKISRDINSINGPFNYAFLQAYSFQDMQQGLMNTNTAFLGLSRHSRYAIGFGTDCPMVQIGIYDNATSIGINMFENDQVDYYRLGTNGMSNLGSKYSFYDSLGRIIRDERINNGDTVWTEYHYNSLNQIDTIKQLLDDWNGLPFVVLSYAYSNGLEVKRTKIDNSMGYTSIDSMVYVNGKITELWNKQKSHSDLYFSNYTRTLVSYNNGVIDFIESQRHDSIQNTFERLSHFDVVNNGIDISRINVYPVNNNTIDSSAMSYFYKVYQSNGQLNRYEFYYTSDTVNYVESTQFDYSQPGFLSKVDHIFDGSVAGGDYYQRNITEFGYTSILDLEDLKTDHFSVYPNPAQDILHIQSDETIDFFEVYDQTGRMLLRDAVTQSAFEINLESLPSGTYLLLLPFSAENKVVRFVKE
ncbi:MAG: T9SS type A sorting domain-containing protein [Crocinitomicaceae bacterium]|jgi:hypothetical protein|nr:T9SS type A sorting domain-containing protein [Crocinitomicaceae bacterium]